MRPAVLITLFAIATVGCGGDGGGATTVQRAPARAESSSATTQSDDPATRPILGLPAGWELAPKGTYSASQKARVVTIKATGESATAGYEVKLFQSPLRIYPPQWMLAHKKPDGFVAQVITPFEVTVSFKADRPVKQVIVSDAAGRHEVSVDQAGD